MNPVSKLRMAVRLTTFRVGLALILLPAACTSGLAWWFSTRNWTPLEMGISLAPGHIRTPEFQVNVEGFYSLVIEIRDSDFGMFPCPGGSGFCQASVEVLTASWALSKNGKVIASGHDEPTSPYPMRYARGSLGLDGFYAAKGTYVLDLELREDERGVTAHQPYLVVYENGGGYFNTSDQLGWAFLTSLLFGSFGISVFGISGMKRRQEESAAFLRRFSLTVSGPLPGEPSARPLRAVLHKPQYPVLRRRSSPPQRANLSRIALVILITFELIFCAICLGWPYKYPIHGFEIRLVRPDAYAEPSLGLQPLIVRVAPGPDRRVIPYVDGKAVSWDGLSALLKTELRQRPPEWPVYVEADPNVEWRDAAKAIDVLRGLSAQVVLLPHRGRER